MKQTFSTNYGGVDKILYRAGDFVIIQDYVGRIWRAKRVKKSQTLTLLAFVCFADEDVEQRTSDGYSWLQHS